MPTPTGPEGWRVIHDSLLRTVQANPGLGVRDLARLTGHSGITVSKHLTVLRDAGQVVAIKDAGRMRHYLPGVEQPPVDANWDEADRLILEFLQRPANMADLRAHMAPMPRTTVAYRVRRLLDYGYLERDQSSPATLKRRGKALRLP